MVEPMKPVAPIDDDLRDAFEVVGNVQVDIKTIAGRSSVLDVEAEAIIRALDHVRVLIASARLKNLQARDMH